MDSIKKDKNTKLFLPLEKMAGKGRAWISR